jgi:hypothetical protein
MINWALKIKKFLLFIDQCAVHLKNITFFRNIKDVFFPCNCTSQLPPLDLAVTQLFKYTFMVPYFPAHKMHRDLFITNFRKNNDECILILVNYWKKTGLLHTKISNHNIMMPYLMF